MATFQDTLDRFAGYRDISRPSVTSATIAVTENYARRKLGLRKSDPLTYRGLTLKCIGSRIWRERKHQKVAGAG